MPAHTPLPPLTFTRSKRRNSVDDSSSKMIIICPDVVLFKLMVKTRFRGQAAMVNVQDLVVPILSLSLGAALVCYYLLKLKRFR